MMDRIVMEVSPGIGPAPTFQATRFPHREWAVLGGLTSGSSTEPLLSLVVPDGYAAVVV